MASKLSKLSNYLWLLLAIASFASAFDDLLFDDESTSTRLPPESLPKDKILLQDVDKLTFHRHKMTTSRRTHSIHQLTCVGGTAGCKLFKPDMIECSKGPLDKTTRRYEWICKADTDDRVVFNHVEVICEGYDYPEDDYILLGSCGLEFTLDYKNPQDYHHNSYYKHMDEHEKEMHQKLSNSNTKLHESTFELFSDILLSNLMDNFLMTCLVLLLVIATLIWIIFRLFQTTLGTSGNSLDKRYLVKAPQHLAAAMLSSKKAC